jgi:FKBP-type peptidyl-prolyl cis-trans isomerase FklB
MTEVIKTQSGLEYEVLESGDGATPGPTDHVTAHYHGTFTDGKVFDSSVDRGQPIDLPVNGVIAGWTEALQMMKEGDKWRLTVPPELGYGAAGVGPIPGNTTLIFEVQLIAVKK